MGVEIIGPFKDEGETFQRTLHGMNPLKNPHPAKFFHYTWSFYGPGKMYGRLFGNRLTRRDLLGAIKIRMKVRRFAGDSFDREKVRDILLRMKKYNPKRLKTEWGPRALRNPFSSKTKRRAVRVASKLAYRIWQHYKAKGYAIPVPKRTPKLVKRYLRTILKANKINWTIKNPLAPFICPICATHLVANYMVVTQHLTNRHKMAYSTVRQLWDIFRSVKRIK